MQGVAAAGHMADARSCPVILGRRPTVDFLRPEPGVVVLELQRRRAVAHLLELPSRLPGIGPSVVAGGVPNGVAGDRAAVEADQLVFPGGVIAVRVGMNQGVVQQVSIVAVIGVQLLCRDVSAGIIGIDPDRTVGSSPGIRRIVGLQKLAQPVIEVFNRAGSVADRLDPAAKVIGITERSRSVVADAGNAVGCGSGRRIAAGLVIVSQDIVAGPSLQGAGLKPAQHVISVADILAAGRLVVVIDGLDPLRSGSLPI